MKFKTKVKKAKLPKRHKAPETVRERISKPSANQRAEKSKIKAKIYRPLSVLRRVAGKEYNPIKVPQSRLGKVLGKRFNLIPSFFVNAFKELRFVTWPTKKMALKLTFAVVVFSLIFAVFVQIFGYFFERLFKYILIS